MRTALIATAVAAAATVGLSTSASAQSWGPPRGAISQECQQALNNNRLAGAAVGAGLGALAGRSVAARGNRTEGAVLGALIGGAVGRSVGGNRLACDDAAYNGYQGYQQAPRNVAPSGYYNDPRYNSYEPAWAPPVYNQPQGQAWQTTYAVPVTRAACGWGEARLTRPDGYSEVRQVWMCQDRRGNWVVQDR